MRQVLRKMFVPRKQYLREREQVRKRIKAMRTTWSKQYMNLYQHVYYLKTRGQDHFKKLEIRGQRLERLEHYLDKLLAERKVFRVWDNGQKNQTRSLVRLTRDEYSKFRQLMGGNQNGK